MPPDSSTSKPSASRTEAGSLHGLLLIDKPGLPAHLHTRPDAADLSTATDAPYLLTSHDVVARVRKWSRQRRIGHTGTLDPMASGLLILCLGWATRLVEYYQGHDKSYEADILLGIATDTWDLVGRVVEQSRPPQLSCADIEQVLQQFRGPIAQTPPIFSAIKQGGESVHRRARRGESVELAPRQVTIRELELLEFAPPERIRLRVRCSAGAYVRSLAYDLGRALGTVATLAALRRDAAGPFQVEDAARLADIEQESANGMLEARLLPPGAGLDLPVVQAEAEALRRLGFGQVVPLPSAAPTFPDNDDAGTAPEGESHSTRLRDDIVQVRDPHGNLAGIARLVAPGDSGATLWKAEKWFLSDTNADIQ